MRWAKLVVGGMMVLATLQPWTDVQAASGSAVLQVRATVRPWLKLSATQPTASYRVTAEDIRRGHIDLPGAVTISMQTNILEGIRIDISSDGPERLLVRNGQELDGAVEMKGSKPSAPVTQSLDMRIILPPDVEEGSYPLLVALAPRAY